MDGGDTGGAVAQTVNAGRDGRDQVAAVLESPQPGRATPIGGPTTPTRTPPIMLQDVYVSKLVAFSPEKDRWMKAKVYRPIGTAYIIGRVYRLVQKGKNASLFQIRWLDSQFQSAVEHISVGMVQLGIKNYIALTRVKNPDWRILARPDPTDDIDFVEKGSDCEEDDVLEAFDPTELLPTSLAEVEAIRNMRFVPSGEVETPSYLYKHGDGSTQSYLRPEFKHLFEHSASYSFFAYIPLYSWRQVLHETNKYAVVNKIGTANQFTLDELMIFLSILFYMTTNDKGEYANYWGLQAEDLIFGGVTTSLDSIMTLHRFKLLRRCLSFNAFHNALDQDAAARIRPLLNLLKITGGQYIHVGRDVALDEASVACRSRQGRHMIVYNSMKPTGKYHFRLYMVCCCTTWVALNYKLHCNRSDIMDRLSGVVDQVEAQNLREELEEVSKIRKHVLEVTRPLFGSNRVVNMDNYYTSVQLLQELRLKGLHGRGTIRSNSKHFPGHTILHKDDCVRGDYRQAVSHDHSMLAASWCDGNVVNLVSNADSTNITTVTRMVGNEKQSFPAPECVAQYNTNMQGVDRLDQIRGRFSTADGHSYKRWHKKLALALIDVARSNAYLTLRLVLSEPATRDPHRKFVMELVGELLNGQRKNAPSDGRMLYSEEMLSDGEADQVDTPSSQQYSRVAVVLPATTCTSVSSRQIHAEKSRKCRRCIVCRWEGRYPTEVTKYCLTHGVCLCRVVHYRPAEPWMCPSTTSTCWDKFHQFYYPNELFTDRGNIRRHSKLAKLKDAHETRPEAVRRFAAARQIAYEPDATDGSIAYENVGAAANGNEIGGLAGLAAFRVSGNAPRGLSAFGSRCGNNVSGLVAFASSGDCRADNRPEGEAARNSRGARGNACVRGRDGPHGLDDASGLVDARGPGDTASRRDGAGLGSEVARGLGGETNDLGVGVFGLGGDSRRLEGNAAPGFKDVRRHGEVRQLGIAIRGHVAAARSFGDAHGLADKRRLGGGTLHRLPDGVVHVLGGATLVEEPREAAFGLGGGVCGTAIGVDHELGDGTEDGQRGEVARAHGAGRLDGGAGHGLGSNKQSIDVAPELGDAHGRVVAAAHGFSGSAAIRKDGGGDFQLGDNVSRRL